MLQMRKNRCRGRGSTIGGKMMRNFLDPSVRPPTKTLQLHLNQVVFMFWPRSSIWRPFCPGLANAQIPNLPRFSTRNPFDLILLVSGLIFGFDVTLDDRRLSTLIDVTLLNLAHVLDKRLLVYQARKSTVFEHANVA